MKNVIVNKLVIVDEWHFIVFIKIKHRIKIKDCKYDIAPVNAKMNDLYVFFLLNWKVVTCKIDFDLWENKS